MNTIKISIRNLVEFILNSGDLTTSSGLKDPDAMQEGTRIHKKLQKSMGTGYNAEVALSITLPVNYDGISFEMIVEGRADGIFTDETGIVIDEIKGVYSELSHMKEAKPVHRAQALCYAYIYATEHKLDGIGIRMTYCYIPTEEVRYFNEYIDYKSLKKWFDDLINSYAKWASWQIKWHETRNNSIKDVEFPFDYREGQNTLVKGVYQSILRSKRLYIEAPTGVGKTISTVFPAVKSMGEGLAEKIFYLTAKTITRTVAQETFGILAESGVQLKYVTVTAKEKICILDKPACNPGTCPRALGHFDRVNDAVYDILTHENNISRDVILAYAEKHNVCPFEMCLDTTTWADAIIGDYNYAFDPTASLKRFFGNEKTNDYIFLVDEAHNLVDRAREMYSALVLKEDFLAAKKLVKSYSKKVTNATEKCNNSLLSMKRDCDNLVKYDSIEIEDFIIRLMRLSSYLEEFLQDNPHSEHPMDSDKRDKLLEFYFNIRSFIGIYEILDDKYIIYADYTDAGEFCLHLQCMDPSNNLDVCLKKARAAIFFSATLLPVRYYMDQLAGKEDDYAIYAPSPFSTNNRLLMIGRDVSTKYTRRGHTEYTKIAEYIRDFAAAKKGNYLVFFPSYKMMNDICIYLCEQYHIHISDYDIDALPPGTNLTSFAENNEEFCNNTSDSIPDIYLQSSSMNEDEREEFLSHFEDTPKRTTLGMCVMGGIFGEGIDLKDSRLIGAVIVGTGLPMVCTENELFREYFDACNGSGFNYAYQYPGMNKVLQAAGRVIRTDSDRGAILLLDERFLQSSYQNLFPKEWFPHEIVNRISMSDHLRRFWER